MICDRREIEREKKSRSNDFTSLEFFSSSSFSMFDTYFVSLLRLKDEEEEEEAHTYI